MNTATPDPATLAASLRSLLARINIGDLGASPAYRARIEGAVVACDVLAGESVDTIAARLSEPVATST